MKLTTFDVIKHAPIDLANLNLSSLPCGLFRCNLGDAPFVLPELKELYDSAPVDNPEEWEIDVKSTC